METFLGLCVGVVGGFFIAFLILKFVQREKWKGKGIKDFWEKRKEEGRGRGQSPKRDRARKGE